MTEKEKETAETPTVTGETQVLDDEELTGIVGGTGGNANNGNGEPDPNTPVVQVTFTIVSESPWE